MGLKEAAKELTYLIYMLNALNKDLKLGLNIKKPIIITDSESA